VRDLYAGDIDESSFVDDMIRLIDEQFDKAWNAGMRENGLDPQTDMTDAWARVLDDRKVQELDYVEQYARDILDAARNGDPIDPLRARVDLWTNRYNEVQNLAKVTTAGKDVLLVWHLGATEQHCDTCSRLNGVVAYASDWEERGLHPQGAPNEHLDCGGWQCDCSLDVADKDAIPTAGGIPKA
jgi:hypothetical protein